MAKSAALWVAANPFRALVLGILGGYALAATIAVTQHWQLADVEVYWRAGIAIRQGQPIYPGSPDPDFLNRYSPWFAWLWAPMTLLPRPAVEAAWSTLLIITCGACVWPALRTRASAGMAAALFFWPLLIRDASSGNVQVLLLASLTWGVERRSGPLWIALAASLKALPLLFAAVYIGRRQWMRAGLSVALTLILAAPILWYGDYPLIIGADQIGLTGIPVAIAALAGAIVLAKTRFCWLLAALAVMFALPRWLPGQPAWLVVSTLSARR